MATKYIKLNKDTIQKFSNKYSMLLECYTISIPPLPDVLDFSENIFVDELTEEKIQTEINEIIRRIQDQSSLTNTIQDIGTLRTEF